MQRNYKQNKDRTFSQIKLVTFLFVFDTSPSVAASSKILDRAEPDIVIESCIIVSPIHMY